MKRKILVGLVASLLLIGAIGCPLEPTVMPVSTLTPTATPSPTLTPTPTLTSVGHGVITIQEFVTNAEAGKYKIGDVLKVCAIKMKMTDSAQYGEGITTYIYEFFGPVVDGLVLFAFGNMVDSSFLYGVMWLDEGKQVTLQGEYKGIEEINHRGSKIKGVVLYISSVGP